MKHRFHKITALLLAAAMLVAFLAACGEEPVDLQSVYKFSETAVTLNAGENYALLIYDDTYSDRSYTAVWSSNNPAAVSVEQSGFITALAAGTATVTANLHFDKENQDVTLNCAITVLETNIAVTGVSINAMEQTLDVGGVTVLTPTVLPADATNKAVSWTTSDPSVAIVSSGVVTAVGAGTAIVTAVTDDGGKTADCIITVNTPVDTFESLTLNKTSVSVAVGKTTSLTATIKPTGIAADIIWTSADESIATVLNGTITGVKAGTTTITATLNDKVTNKVATCKVTVTSSTSSTSSGSSSSGNSGSSSSGNSGSSGSSSGTSTTVKATSVKFDVQSMTVYVGQKGPWKFNPTVTPANTTEKGTWTSNNPSVAAVDSEGNITIGDIGSSYFEMATITYTVGSKSASGVVVVMAASSNPNPENNETENQQGENQTPSENTNPNENEQTPSENTETQTPSTGEKAVTSLILAEDTATINVGQAYAIEFDAYPKDAVGTYTWLSANEAIATVTASGVVTGQAVGETTVTVTETKSGISQTCKVVVKLKEAESVTLSNANVTLPLGQTYTLYATVTPDDTSETLTWTSQYPEIVSVSPLADGKSALIASLQSGTVVITASTPSGKKAECTVASGVTGYDSGDVTQQVSSKIKVSVVVIASGDLEQGNAYSAYLTFSPALSTAQQATLMYAISTQDNTVAITRTSANDYTKNSFTITPTVAAGSATLTGFVSSSDASLQFEYEPKTVSILSPSADIKTPIKSLTMSPTSLSLYSKATSVIAVTPTPSNNDDELTWFSSNESVAKVVGNKFSATVIAVGAGTATITAKTRGNLTTNKVTATCRVTVSATGSVDTGRSVIGVMQGSTYQPTNADIGATGSFAMSPTWTPGSVFVSGGTDNSYALTIDKNGLITIGDNVPIGTTLATSVSYAIANAGTLVQKDFTIMVINAKATGSTTSAPTVTMNVSVGDIGDFSNYPGTYYTSDNPQVVRINNSTWYAEKAGTTSIHIYDKDGDGKVELITVKFVVGNPVIEKTINVDELIQIADISELSGKTIKGISSSSSSRVSVSSVNGQYVLKGESGGSADVTVTLGDDSQYIIRVTVRSSSSSGSSSSTTTSPKLSLSPSSSVKGGSEVKATLSNLNSMHRDILWKITGSGATFEGGVKEISYSATVLTKEEVIVYTADVTEETVVKIEAYYKTSESKIGEITLTIKPQS